MKKSRQDPKCANWVFLGTFLVVLILVIVKLFLYAYSRLKTEESLEMFYVYGVFVFLVFEFVGLMVWNERKIKKKNLELENANAQLSSANESLTQAREITEQALKVAESANRAKSFFLANMSHDIRTPLNSVVGFSALLSQNTDQPEKVREYTEKISTSSQHLLGIINDVLDMSKIDSGKAMLRLSEESVTEIVAAVQRSIRPQMEAKKQFFQVDIHDIVHDRIIADKLRLRQILVNLLENAINYTQENGKICLEVSEIRSYERMGYFRFVVSDNGYGMSEEFQKKVFDMFQREEDERISRIPGTGLGMPITKSLIDLMGGSITVESKKEEGSVFTVELLLEFVHSVEMHRFLEENGILNCLVVDDEEKNGQEVVSLLTKEAGICADYARSGREAIGKIQFQGKYQAVLLDSRMPVMGGLETARQIRTMLQEKAPVLILTGDDGMKWEKSSLYGIVDGVLPGEFDLRKFKKVLEKILIPKEEKIVEDDMEEGGILEGKHILVAEDNEMNASLLSDFLELAGASCEVFENGQLAVDAFLHSEPGLYDFILMDIRMPRMNGYEATRAIRQGGHPMSHKIPIIAMTANAFPEDVKEALASGMNAHVAKPLSMDALEKAVRKCLEA